MKKIKSFDLKKYLQQKGKIVNKLLIKALKNKAKILEIKGGLRCDKRTRQPHLKTWRDGMRHLLFILSEAPKFFEWLGFSFLSFSILGELLSILFGAVQIGDVVFFDYHSKLVFFVCMIFGMESWIFSSSLFIFKNDDHPTKVTTYLMKLREENLFFLCLVIFLFVFLSGIWIFLYWKSKNFHGIHLVNPMVDFLYFVTVLFLFCVGLLQIHILKRVLKEGK